MRDSWIRRCQSAIRHYRSKLVIHICTQQGLQGLQVDGGATPGWAGGETPGAGGVPKKQRSRWDETPMGVAPSATPMMGGATPSMTPGATPLMTPGMAAGMETPSPSAMQAGVSALCLCSCVEWHVWDMLLRSCSFCLCSCGDCEVAVSWNFRSPIKRYVCIGCCQDLML